MSLKYILLCLKHLHRRCRFCLDFGLTKATIKCHFSAKSGYLILVWVLGDINFVCMNVNSVIMHSQKCPNVYRCMRTWCMNFTWKYFKYHCNQIRKNAKRGTWNKQAKMALQVWHLDLRKSSWYYSVCNPSKYKFKNLKYT